MVTKMNIFNSTFNKNEKNKLKSSLKGRIVTN
jgi:hypothetical protein